MILYIVRHAIAAPVDASRQKPDSDRPLTSKGRRRMQQIAQGLRRLRAELDLILTSPYLRTQQTARILAKTFALGDEQLLSADDLAPTGDPGKLISDIRVNHSDVERIALVGHEPYASALISMLIAGDAGLSILLKRGGVCKLSMDSVRYGQCATLEWLLAPAQLVAIAGA
jgi:phosphohistidine phosphatase